MTEVIRLSRRRFIKLLGGSAATIATLGFAPSLSQVRALHSLWSPQGGPFDVYVFSPLDLLSRGQRVTITGVVRDGSGRPLANEMIGVEDGLTMWSSWTTTDSSGMINYPVRVNTSGAAIVEFVVRGYKYPFVFQAVSDLYTRRANPLGISALQIQNASYQDLRAVTTVYNGTQYRQRIPRGTTQTLVQTFLSQAAKRVTVFGGGTFTVGAGIAGGDVAVTVDNRGVATTSVSGGGYIVLRGSAYATSQGGLGACWAPGGDLGVSPVSLSGEIALCYGSDGISLSGSGSAAGAIGGFSVDLTPS